MSVNSKILGRPVIKKMRALSAKPEAKTIYNFFEEVTKLTKFNFRFFKEVFRPRYEFNEVIRQSYLIGYKSFPLVAITGFIMGLVLTIQTRPTLVEFGADSMLPEMVSISIIRELGPAITALIFAGKVGSGIGAELASMKVTEQIDAMEVAGLNPFKYLVVTRIVSTTIMLPLLVIAGDAVSIYGSYIAVNIQGHTSFLLFFNQVIKSLDFSDVFPATIKTFFFGYAIGAISCYKGYTSNKGTEGVGMAANSAVIISSLSIFILDMIAVQVAGFFI
jgi:phospholipid/cholesterol/gamma-HCH transport system permease protein